MILSFKHKGLELFFKTGKKSGINAQHSKKLQLILGAIQAATAPKDMNLPGLFLHSLSGRRAEYGQLESTAIGVSPIALKVRMSR